MIASTQVYVKLVVYYLAYFCEHAYFVSCVYHPGNVVVRV